MIHQINLACGVWPEGKLWTKDKKKVTCGQCKNSRPYKIKNFSLKDVVR